MFALSTVREQCVCVKCTVCYKSRCGLGKHLDFFLLCGHHSILEDVMQLHSYTVTAFSKRGTSSATIITQSHSMMENEFEA
jgi:hypothetical protein